MAWVRADTLLKWTLLCTLGLREVVRVSVRARGARMFEITEQAHTTSNIMGVSVDTLVREQDGRSRDVTRSRQLRALDEVAGGGCMRGLASGVAGSRESGSR